jgi:hypothetical protein
MLVHKVLSTGPRWASPPHAPCHLRDNFLKPVYRSPYYAVRRNMGRRAHQRVRRHFLMTRLLEDWLDLIAALTRRPARSSVEERRSAA